MVATVPTACGIETLIGATKDNSRSLLVATVPTACGIETSALTIVVSPLIMALQQYLPLAVLKPSEEFSSSSVSQLSGCNSTYRLRY